MATATTLTSELEAVNIILEAADEAPVTSLALSGLYPLEKAKGCLNEASRLVQSMGWEFNTEEDFVVVRSSGTATLPGNVVSFDVNDDITSMDLVQRGLRLYDKTAHSYTLSEDPKGTAVLLLEWTDLPEPARRFILIKAARLMQGRSSVSDTTLRISEEDEVQARVALEQHEAAAGDHNMLRDSLSVSAVLANYLD